MTVHQINNPPTPLDDELHLAVMRFLAGRNDTCLWGAHAVNAYTATDDQRHTVDVDFHATNARGVANELREYLKKKFDLTIQIKKHRDALSLRDITSLVNRRKVADINQSETLPPYNVINGVQVITLEALIAAKEKSSIAPRRKENKVLQDRADLVLLKRQV